MTRSCLVTNCEKNNQHVQKRVLYKLPAHLNSEWIAFLHKNKCTPKKSTVICSLHFLRNDVIGPRKLRPGCSPVDYDSLSNKEQPVTHVSQRLVNDSKAQ